MLHGSCIVKIAKLRGINITLQKSFRWRRLCYIIQVIINIITFFLMINFTEQVMPVRIFGLFGLHHGLEIELKSKIKESIQEEAFFDYNNRSYEIQSYSLTGSRRYINVRQIPNPGLYPSKKKLEILPDAS